MRYKPSIWVNGLVILYTGIFIAVGIVTLPHYGLTWDEGLGNLFFGERYFHFFATGDSTYLSFNNNRLAIHQRQFNLYRSPYRQKAYEFPPFADTLSAASMELFTYQLGWMDPVDAFHLPKVLLSGVLLFFLFRYFAPRLGTTAAFLGIVLLSTFPRFWADMHFNPKDIPIAVFFAFIILAYLSWYERPSFPRALAVGFLGGLALSIKANAVFIPIVIVLGFWPWQRKWPPWGEVTEHIRNFFTHYFTMITVACTVHIISWPFLYASPLPRLYRYYKYIFSQGNRTGPESWNPDAIIQTIATMPELTLILLIFGIAIAIIQARKAKQIHWLLLAWMFIPIIRASVPGAVNFDGIRHFEEFLPAACLLAGIGGAWLIDLFAKDHARIKKLLLAGHLFIITLNTGMIIQKYGNYQHLYYNSLVGGLSGAREKYNFPDATDYWGSSYRSGIRWLNDHAVRHASLTVPIANWVARLTAPIWLRIDIDLINQKDVDQALEEGRTVYVMFITREHAYTSLVKYCLDNFEPVHQILVDGVPILQIYQLKNAQNSSLSTY